MSVSTYIAFYYCFLLVFTIGICLIDVRSIEKYQGILTIILLSFVFIHIGFRPLDPLFGDMRTYARKFNEMCLYHSFETDKDYFFYFISFIISRFTQSTTVYFSILCLGYILPIYFAFKNKVPHAYFLLLLIFVGAFSFWSYGVNGLRNGLGTSFFILGLFSGKDYRRLVHFALSIAFHTSLALPVVAFFIIKYVLGKPKLYLFIWFICLLTSLFVGQSLGDILGSFSFINGFDERMDGYLASSFEALSEVEFSHQGFRWDFVIYSAIPIVLGTYYMYYKDYDNSFYKLMLCIYLLCNAFWLLTIYVPFNNRFAYLSWFMHPILILYPLLTDDNFVGNQNSRWIHWTIMINYIFTFIMWIR